MQGPWMQAMALYAVSRRRLGVMPDAKALPTYAVIEPVVPRAPSTSQIVSLALAANRGNAEAQYTLGVFGLVGKLGTVGQRKAHALLAAAAMRNHPGACFVLGTLHQQGALMPHSPTKALHLFQKAARAGHARSQNALAQMMLSGNGLPRDTAGAISLLNAAIAQGLNDAKANLGVLYIHENTTPGDCARGIELLTDAAVNGVIEAQYYLGWVYHTGLRVPQDLGAARKWYGMAAEGGKAKAQYNLMLMLLRPASDFYEPVTALKWLLILATGQDQALKEVAGKTINQLAPQLSADQVAQATDAALDWLEQHNMAVWTPLQLH